VIRCAGSWDNETVNLGRTWLVAGLVAWSLTGPAAAQSVSVVRFTVREGLAQSQVSTLLQDGCGFLWIGTQGGLSRYDGARFVTWTTAEGLPDDVVTALAEAGDGTVWIGTDSGTVARRTPDGFDVVARLTEGASGGVLALTAVGRDAVLAGTASGTYRVTSDGAVSRVAEAVRIFVRAGSGVWAVERGATWSVAQDGTSGERLETPSPVTAAAARGDDLLLALEDGTVWSAKRRGPSGIVAPRGIGVTALAVADDGTVWIGTDRGLWRHRPGGALEAVSLAIDRLRIDVRRLLVDGEGDLWIGTWGQGLVQLPPGEPTLFTPVTGLPANTVWAMDEDASGCVWMATGGAGVVSWCGDHWGTVLDSRSGLPSDLALTVRTTRDGAVWIGTDRGLVRCGPDGRLQRWDERNGLPNRVAREIAEDGEGRIWIATSGGLAVREDNRWRSWRQGDGLPGPLIRALDIDSRGIVWMATHTAGVVRFDGQRFRAFTTKDGLPVDRVWSLMVDGADRVWAGTDAGIWVHDPSGGEADRVIGIADGLPSRNILFLVEDREGSIWVGTTRGVARLSPQGKVLTVLTAEDGLPDSEAAENAALCDRSGAVWLGMAGGVARIRPGSLRPPSRAIHLVLERVQIDGAAVPVPSGPEIPLVVPPGSAEIRLEVTAPSLRNARRLRFRYRLEPQDPDWSLPTDERHVTYRRLDPGRYRFRARVEDAAGVVLGEGPPLRLELQPYWYQTRTARWGAVILLLAIVAGAVAFRIRMLERRRRELERLVAERTAELADANERLEELSRTDPLTGLANRRVAEDALPVEVRLARREIMREGVERLPEFRGVGVVMLDLDRFKAVNDAYGHEVGDAVLVSVAGAVSRTVREVDEVVRWGGEEILVIARSVTPGGLVDLAGRLLRAVAAVRVPVPDGGDLTVTASAGFVPYPLALQPPVGEEQVCDWLVAVADRLLYMAKERGRARAVGIRIAGVPPEGLDEGMLVTVLLGNPAHPPPGLVLEEIVPD